MDDGTRGLAGATRPSHRWDLDPAAARALQRELAAQVVRGDRLGERRLIAGLDLGFPKDAAGGVVGRAALVVLRASDLGLVEGRLVARAVTFS